MHTAIHIVSTSPPAWFPEPDMIHVEAVRTNHDTAGLMRAYFEKHPGAIGYPDRAAQRISELYGVDACEVLLLIHRIIKR